jgi:hypothetical protein
MLALVTDNDVVANAWSAVQIVSVLVGTLIPILTALVTRSTASSGVKAVVSLGLSAVTGFGTEFINAGDAFYWQGALLTTIVTFVTSVATYYGLWKPTNVAGSNSAAARAFTG